MNTSRWASCVRITVFTGALFFSALVYAVPPIDVVLEVGAGPALKVLTNSSSCSGAADDSCIEVAAGEAPFLKFKLPHACDNTADDPLYELTGMRITMINKDWPTAANPLNAVVAKDFKADPTTGEIKFHSGKNKKNPRLLKLKNLNSKEYTVFYEITASPCDDASNLPDLVLDPQIRNRG